MNKTKIYMPFAAVCATVALWSCAADADDVPVPDRSQGVPVVIDVTMPEEPRTRYKEKDDDLWSVRRSGPFEVGKDAIGILTSGGNLTGHDGHGHRPENVTEDQLANMNDWLINEPLYYERPNGSSSRFANDELLMNPSMMVAPVARYVYFPYDQNMDQIIRPKDENELNGMNLRRTDVKNLGDDIERCVDYMYISSPSVSTGQLTGRFVHGFSEIVVTRGEGFNKPINKYGVEDNSIWVVLTQPYTRIRINGNTAGTSWSPQIFYKSTDLNEDDARRWQMWKGKPLTESTTDDDGQPQEKDYYYVLLPTHPVTPSVTSSESYKKSIYDLWSAVEYIELYDNNGNLQKVSNFDLTETVVNTDGTQEVTGEGDKKLKPGYRYELEILLVELEATVRPVKIGPWCNGEDITDVREVGIASEAAFTNWLREYNQRVADGNTNPGENKEDPLYEYGDYNLTDNKWTFYIKSDITLSNAGTYTINTLKDNLVGSSGYSNYTISNLRSPLVEKIEGGSLKNLDFDNVFIRISNKAMAGALANSVTRGTIERCNVTGTVKTTGAVGMLCGSVENSKVMNCTASGALIGKTTYGGSGGTQPGANLFGVAPDAASTIENVDGSDVIFSSLTD